MSVHDSGRGSEGMETWFVKSVVATISVAPVFIAISFFKARGIDPLVFLVWYFGATALSIAVVLVLAGNGGDLLPPAPALAAIFAIGLVLGAVANGLLFQAVGLAPNPGLPPVIYATASIIVFVCSALFANVFPTLFKAVNTDPSRLAGILLVIAGLYLLAGGKLSLRAVT